MATRRQGIFWLCTLPAPSALMEGIAAGNLPSAIVWARGQLEKGGTTDYLHYQFVVGFAAKTSLAGIKAIFGRTVHAELSRSALANEYVGKEETRVGETFEHGAKPFCRNAKTDWEAVWEAAKVGELSLIPANVRVVSYRTLRAIGSDYAKPKAITRECWVFWGTTGTGKSRRAWDEAGECAYSKNPRSKFWDGYQGQENIVLDEFRGGIDVAHLLRWLDRYPVSVEVKGSARPLDARKIWITSNISPREWYPELDSETQSALLRRMQITHFN